MTDMRPTRPARDGYILVAVLGVMLLLTGLMSAGSLLLRSVLDTVKVGDADVEMRGLTRGGLELAAYQLFTIEAAPAAVDGRRIKFGGGIVSPRLVDEGGKADLNGSDPAVLTALFRSAGLDERASIGLMAYVVEMRGKAGTAAGPQAAPVAPKPKPPRRGFQSVEQLLDFADLSRNELAALRPALTVYNPGGRINILSASPGLLAAIPGLSGADVAAIVARRDSLDKKDVDSFVATLKGAEPYIKAGFGPAFTVRVDAVSAQGRKKSIGAVIAASKSPNTPYYVLDWWEAGA